MPSNSTWPSEAHSAAPLTMPLTASVATKEWIPSLATSRPLTMPTKPPPAKTSSAASGQETPSSPVRMAMKTIAAPSTAPAEKSNSPETRGNSNAMASSPGTAWFAATPFRLVSLRKVSLIVAPKTTIRRISSSRPP